MPGRTGERKTRNDRAGSRGAGRAEKEEHHDVIRRNQRIH